MIKTFIGEAKTLKGAVQEAESQFNAWTPANPISITSVQAQTIYESPISEEGNTWYNHIITVFYTEW